MTYNFNKKIQVGKFEIQVDEAEKYGYFEHDELGDEAGGGLWFSLGETHEGEPTEDPRLQLSDYDGMYYLPQEVAAGLRRLGYVVDESFE
jgi:hypothetical protein